MTKQTTWQEEFEGWYVRAEDKSSYPNVLPANTYDDLKAFIDKHIEAAYEEGFNAGFDDGQKNMKDLLEVLNNQETNER